MKVSCWGYEKLSFLLTFFGGKFSPLKDIDTLSLNSLKKNIHLRLFLGKLSEVEKSQIIQRATFTTFFQRSKCGEIIHLRNYSQVNWGALIRQKKLRVRSLKLYHFTFCEIFFILFFSFFFINKCFQFFFQWKNLN